MLSPSVRFLNIILAALLAGTSFGIWMILNGSNLSPAAFIEQQQNIISSLNATMTTLVISATIITILSAFIHKQNKPVFISLILAAICFIACILISRFGNQAINNSIMELDPKAISITWPLLRDRWLSFHILRTIAELIALSLIAWTNVRS